jgi:molybdenum cofactor cytidylyltransferase
MSRERDEIATIVAVLAAGRSSRMGFPKALIDLAGESALERVLRLAREQRLESCVVLGFHAERVRAEVRFGATRVVRNPDPEDGQSSSVRCAARALPNGAALLLWPVDHARVEAETLATLRAAWEARPPGTEIVVPSHALRRGHPAWFSPRAAAELRELPDDAPAHVVVRRDPARVLHVVVADPMVVADFDRPEDLRG